MKERGDMANNNNENQLPWFCNIFFHFDLCIFINS